MTLSVENMRETFAKGDTLRDQGLETPKEIRRFDNLSYGENGIWNRLDIYQKKEVKTCQPTIVSIHGGGWVYGNKEAYQYYCMDLALRGFTVVNFNYGLAPEHPYPQALTDINQLFAFLMDYQEEYYMDANNLFVVGDSAGAQLASQYAVLLTNMEYQKFFSFAIPNQLKIKAVALNCGMYDVRKFVEEGISEGIVQAYIGKPDEKTLQSLDVMKYLSKDFPPTFLTTGYYDFLKESAKPMIEALQQHQVHSEFKLYGQEGNQEIAHVFHLNIRLEQAKKCNDDTCTFFKKLIS